MDPSSSSTTTTTTREEEEAAAAAGGTACLLEDYPTASIVSPVIIDHTYYVHNTN
jgi:hypothetical protein